MISLFLFRGRSILQKTKKQETEKHKFYDEGRELFIYLLRPGCARFSSASLHPSAHSLCRTGGHCCLQAPAFSGGSPANPACPGSPNGPCAAPSQVPFAAPCRRRYNTLDLASKIVCQGRPCPLWIPPPRNRPVSLDASPQRKSRMKTVILIPRFLCQRERRPL